MQNGVDMIKESVLRDTIINAGFTFSPENGEDYPLRQVPLNALIQVVSNCLQHNGVTVIEDTPCMVYHADRR